MRKTTFSNLSRDLVVITTVTNWDEPPRIRHEIALQLVRQANVLFVQVYCQRNRVRRKVKVSESLIVEKAGLCFPGLFKVMLRLPILMRMYNRLLSIVVGRLVKKYGYDNATLLNFQFNAPELQVNSVFSKTAYFCNEDFVNQYLQEPAYIKNNRQRMQDGVIKRSDVVFAVSEPLKRILQGRGAKNVHVILSGHHFDPERSIECVEPMHNKTVKACYMGFMNHFIAIDWLINLCKEEGVELTIIGPVSSDHILNKFVGCSSFKHKEYLVGAALQDELLRQDVLLMPYSSPVDNEVTTAPAKLFQYLATGRPIVSSRMPNLISMPDKFVYQAGSYSSFLKCVNCAISEDTRGLRMKRIEFSKLHTWDARGNLVLKILSNLEVENDEDQ